jgi:hypothetical protein
METISKQTEIERRLGQLETESQSIIESYLQQVTLDANSLTIKTLQSKLKDVRKEQWKLFNKLSPRFLAAA